mmetsp:Transcript_18290/g.54586  ORF Transcript_18290/g.54586 Transcript_18290/m.54586 type:complete len:213 (-) Transcript_18290:241-879(-)
MHLDTLAVLHIGFLISVEEVHGVSLATAPGAQHLRRRHHSGCDLCSAFRPTSRRDTHAAVLAGLPFCCALVDEDDLVFQDAVPACWDFDQPTPTMAGLPPHHQRLGRIPFAQLRYASNNGQNSTLMRNELRYHHLHAQSILCCQSTAAAVFGALCRHSRRGHRAGRVDATRSGRSRRVITVNLGPARRTRSHATARRPALPARCVGVATSQA